MKILFNPNKNVGVYVENMSNTLFPMDNKKRGNDCQICAFVMSTFLPLTLRLFVCKIDFFPQDLIILDHEQPSTTINTIEAHQKPSSTMR